MDWFGLFEKAVVLEKAVVFEKKVELEKEKELEVGFVPTVQTEVDNEELSGLNLKQVLDAHTAWKTRLIKIIEGTSYETPNIAVVSQDNQCFLGKWLYSEGKALYGHLPEYESVRKVHAEFHLYAGEVLEQHRLGYDEVADVLLKTKVRSASNKNQMLLTRLFIAARLQTLTQSDYRNA
jgi:Chemoreceptor zinc-binding domain